MDLELSEIAEAVKAPLAGGAGVRVTGVTWDSRSVAPGDLYVALVGERVDGHDFVADAVDSGAVAVLATREVASTVPVVAVDDALRALADLAAFWRGRLAGTVIGLTGSSGKTTTKNLVRDVLACDLEVVATKANQNNELGVPATLLSADASAQAVVVEMGMRGAGQIAGLASIARPDWGLVTNVGESHIELLGSREAIARAKAELYEALPDGRGLAFVNADDGLAAEMCEAARLGERGVTVVRYSGSGREDAPHVSGENGAFVWASGVSLDAEGRPSFTLNAVGFEQMGLPGANGSRPCSLKLLGLHNVSNACAAAAVGLSCGLSLDSCCGALAASRPETGRAQVRRSPAGLTVVDDAYNANPDSMAASLSTFAAMEVPGRRVAVLGDMLELGERAAASHRRAGRLAAGSGIDLLVCVGPLSRLAAEAARGAGMDAAAVLECDDAAAALDLLGGRLGPGDAVLVKASHSIGLETVAEGLVI